MTKSSIYFFLSQIPLKALRKCNNQTLTNFSKLFYVQNILKNNLLEATTAWNELDSQKTILLIQLYLLIL